MTIADAREKCKRLVSRVPRDVLIISILVLASSLSFGLGYLAGLDTILASPAVLPNIPAPTESAAGQVVASRSGTKYYVPSCAGAERISEANKVWFASAELAAAAGYAPAANCKGI